MNYKSIFVLLLFIVAPATATDYPDPPAIFPSHSVAFRIQSQNTSTQFSNTSDYINVSNVSIVTGEISFMVLSNFRLWIGDNFMWEFYVEKTYKNQFGWWLFCKIFPFRHEWIE